MVRINLTVSRDLDDMLTQVAEEEGCTRLRAMQTGFALLKVCRDAVRAGKHVGLVADPSRLETEIVGMF